MNNIDFEKDQTEVLDRTENIKSLANQVKKLRDLEDQVKAEEASLYTARYLWNFLSGMVSKHKLQIAA